MFRQWYIALICFFCISSFTMDEITNRVIKKLDERVGYLERAVGHSSSGPVIYNYYYGKKRSFLRRITKYAVIGSVVYVAYTYVTSNKNSKLCVFVDNVYQAGKNSKKALDVYVAPWVKEIKKVYCTWTTLNTTDSSSKDEDGESDVSKEQKNEKK